MDKNTQYLIGAVAIGGGLFLAYKKGAFDKILKGGNKPLVTPSETETTQETNAAVKEAQQQTATSIAEKAIANTIIQQTTTIANPNSLQGKISYIQGELGIKVDGIAEDQTNGAFERIYGLDKGNISADNIVYYMQKVKSKMTKTKQAMLAKQSGDAKLIVNAINRKGTIRFLKEFKAPALVKNKATGGFTPTGDYLTFKDKTILGGGWKAGVRGNNVLLTKNGRGFYEVIPTAIVVI
jgi:hypothetical protein